MKCMGQVERLRQVESQLTVPLAAFTVCPPEEGSS